MISQETFMGGAKQIELAGDTLIGRNYRFLRVTVDAAGGGLKLPDARKMALGGTQFLIENVDASQSFLVYRNQSAVSLLTLEPNRRAKLHLIDNSTADGIWVSDQRQVGPSSNVPMKEGAIVGGSVSSKNVTRLDNATETWITGVSPSNARIDACSFGISDGLYIGGHWALNGSSSLFDVYRLNTWRNIGATTVPFGLSGAGSALGKGYFLSGGDITDVQQFDPVLSVWVAKNDIGYERRAAACASINGKIYMACGRPLKTPSIVYHPLVDSFSNLHPYVGPNRLRLSAFRILNTMIVCGGKEDDGTVSDLVEELDVVTETWMAGIPLPMGGRYGGGAFDSNYRGYYASGKDSSETEQPNAATYRGNAWTSIANVLTNAFKVENASQSTT